ncbi:unnamed protein product [Macrosiphum euphorbiae]|uniref:RING-type domain-containing protein n=1 Tax=Macrosiphum euphorbiae TaxID=13131 RepID=A0AAV0WWW6_9HEMI|nr:unnamed protein product [Macrosiphum euphorbiae]
MVCKCVVPNCGVVYAKASNVKLYRFPRNKVLKSKWMKICSITKHLVHYKVCGRHFLPEDIKENGHLKPSVVPSIQLGTNIRPNSESTSQEFFQMGGSHDGMMVMVDGEPSSEVENIVSPMPLPLMPVEQVPPNEENIDNNAVDISSEDENIALPMPLPLMPVEQVPPNEENIDNNAVDISSEDENIALPMPLPLMPVEQVPPNDENIELPNRAIDENREPEEHDWDERDFFVPEEVAVARWWAVMLARNQPEAEDIPYVQVDRNNPEVGLYDDSVCVVCRDNTRTHALVPCGHKVLCEECVNQLLYKRCPLCNTVFRFSIRIWE